MLSRGILSVLTAVVLTWPSQHARADGAEVEALIAKGNELRRAGTPGPALPYFRKAYELARTPRTSCQLGLAELDAGYPVEAAEHLAAALQSASDPSIAKYQAMLTAALTRARSQIGELAVEGSPAGAEVVVNGRAMGVLPLSSAIKLPAHDAEVTVRAPGYAPLEQIVPIVGGQKRVLVAHLDKMEQPREVVPAVTPAPALPSAPVASSTAPGPTIVDQRASTQPRSNASGSALRTSAWIVGGSAVLAAGGGLALNLAARSNLADFNGSCVNMNGIHMISGQRLTQSDCEDRFNTWQSDRRWSIAGYVAGAALAATSGVLFWLSGPTSPPSDARAGVSCAPTPSGLSCEGLF
jgi:hypothetical protein